MNRFNQDGLHNVYHVPDSEWSTIVNALRTAAGVYDDIVMGSSPRHSEQFSRQAAKARALADKIAEEAGV
jgi:hypothetical protein